MNSRACSLVAEQAMHKQTSKTGFTNSRLILQRKQSGRVHRAMEASLARLFLLHDLILNIVIPHTVPWHIKNTMFRERTALKGTSKGYKEEHSRKG